METKKQLQRAQVLKLIGKGINTAPALAFVLGVGRKTVVCHLNYAKSLNEIHVVNELKSKSGSPTKVYALGRDPKQDLFKQLKEFRANAIQY